MKRDRDDEAYRVKTDRQTDRQTAERDGQTDR